MTYPLRFIVQSSSWQSESEDCFSGMRRVRMDGSHVLYAATEADGNGQLFGIDECNYLREQGRVILTEQTNYLNGLRGIVGR